MILPICHLRFRIYDLATMRRGLKIAGALVVIWLVGWLIASRAVPTPRQAFGRYVGSIPRSVDNVVYEGNDWLGLAPECRCYFSFNIASNDFARIVKKHGFESVRPGAGYYHPNAGPWWFKPPQSNGQFLGRYVPTRPYRFPRWGQNEYLWLDQTGTNAFFMVWRMD